MPQATVADVQPPAAPAPPGQPVATQAPPVALGPISREQAEFLRLRRNALSTQLESVQERRDDVAEQLRSDETQAAERPGLQERLRVLDERLIQLEQEIATNSAALANAPSRRESSTSEQRHAEPFWNRFNPNAVTFFSFALLMPFAIQLSRRYFAPDRGPSRSQIAETRALTERMNQIETAIDTVAIEVERIGESQRFLTAAMTENIRQPGALGVPVPAYESVPINDRDGSERR